MFQHSAIENLVNPSFASVTDKEFKEVIHDLKESQNFYLGFDDEVTGMASNSYFSGRIGDLFQENDLYLPYPSVVFWTERKSDGSKAGILVQQGEDAFFVRYLIHNRQIFKKSWILWPAADLISLGEGHGGFQTIILSPQGKYSSTFEGDASQRSDRLTRGELLVILDLALRILSCRNIRYEKINPPEKLNKKRRKKGKEELVSYHVLKIAPMSPKKQTKSDVAGTGESPRVHLCRGHFKTYTEEAPLFGKYTGRFWWQPQVRGEKQKGIVHKDYNVEV